MKRRLRANLALFAGVIALGVAVWLTWPRQPAPSETVSALAPKTVTHITLHSRGHVIELARDGAYDAGRWRIQAPVCAPANSRRVASILALAARVPTHRYPPASIDTATTGLADPTLTLRFNDQAPIAIGNPGPDPGTRYVRTAHALLLANVAHLTDAPLGWSHWVAHRVIADDATIVKLVLPHLTLSRNGAGIWQVEPRRADRGADYARATVRAWRHARALDVRPLNPARARQARVTLRFADHTGRRLDVIERRPELILRDDELGVDYHLAASQAGPLLDMAHPAALGAARTRHLRRSPIPLATDPRSVQP